MGRDEDLPKVAAVVSDGLECLEIWVRLAGSNDFFAWNFLFCPVVVAGGDAQNEQKIHQVAGKKHLNEVGERGRKEKLLNS